MVNIIYLICIALIGFSVGAFAFFVISKLRKIKDKIDNILISRHPWGMGVYMDEIPQNEQNTARLVSVPVKIYDRSEYSDILVPRKGEEISGIYYSGEHKFEMTGIVTRIFYNVDIGWIVASCKCTDIQKLK